MTNYKISRENCIDIKKRIYNDEDIRDIADDFEVSSQTIRYHANNACSHDTNIDKTDIVNKNGNDDESDINIKDMSIEELAENSDMIELYEDDFDIFSLLSSYRRRLTILILDILNRPSSTAELADIITHMEFDKFNSYNRKKVYVGLYQEHLPKMDKLDVIEYDDHSVIPNQTIKILANYINDGYILKSEVENIDENIKDQLEKTIRMVDDNYFITERLRLAGIQLSNNNVEEAGNILKETGLVLENKINN